MKVIKSHRIMSLLNHWELIGKNSEYQANRDEAHLIPIEHLRKWIDIESLDAKEVAAEADRTERSNKILGVTA